MTDATGTPLPGLGLDQSHAIVGNFVDHAVEWGNSKHQEPLVAKYAGHAVRLRFVMAASDLYAFHFASKPSFTLLKVDDDVALAA